MRIRISFDKTEAMRFTGHLDLHKTWERVFRRAGLPLAYSHGFHPQPRLNLACALPLGFTSQAEVLDAWLETDLPTPEVQSTLVASLPPGIRIRRVIEVSTPAPAVQTLVTSADYEITLHSAPADLPNRIQGFLEATTLPRVWRNKNYDLRPLVESLEFLPVDELHACMLRARLAAREGATGRPEELLSALDIPFTHARVHRTALVTTTSLEI